MIWKAATLSQLYEIAFNDAGAALVHRQAAADEIKRRKRRTYGRVSQKKKAVYHH